jgi:hypothetical protein
MIGAESIRSKEDPRTLGAFGQRAHFGKENFELLFGRWHGEV